MGIAEVNKILGPFKKPNRPPGFLKRKLQINYRAARSMYKTMRRQAKLAKKFMKRSGKNLSDSKKKLQNRVTKLVIKGFKRVAKRSKKKAKTIYKMMEKSVSKRYALQVKEDSKKDFRGLAGKKQKNKQDWSEFVGKDPSWVYA